MARMRSIKPELWADRALARLSRDARLLYIALWNFADEHARLHGDPRFVKGHAFPYDDDLSIPAVDELLVELEAAGRIVRYGQADDPYIFLPHLAKHQRLEPGKVPSRLPEPPSESRADEFARGADEFARRADSSAPRSEPIVAKHVACGMEHVAGSMRASLDRLAAALQAAGLTATAARLTGDELDQVARAIDRVGVGALVAAAQRTHQPDNPAVSWRAWLPAWSQLRPSPRPEPAASGTCRRCGLIRVTGDGIDHTTCRRDPFDAAGPDLARRALAAAAERRQGDRTPDPDPSPGEPDSEPAEAATAGAA